MNRSLRLPPQDLVLLRIAQHHMDQTTNFSAALSDSPLKDGPTLNAEATQHVESARRSRFSRKPQGGLELQERDAALLCDLFLFGAMARSQINELHFSSVPRCNARLRKLYDFGLVHRHFAPLSPWGSPAVYFPAQAAFPSILAELEQRELDLEPGEVARTCRSNTAPAFLEHTLACVDFYLQMRRAAESVQGVELQMYLSETVCRHPYEIEEPYRGWRTEVFKPDAFLRLQFGAQEVPSFVEIDRGHASSAKFADKVASFVRYDANGLYAESYGPSPFRVLVVTTGKLRLSHLLQAAVRELQTGGPHLREMLFTTFAEIEAAGPFERHWRSTGQGGGVSPLDGF